MRAQGPKSVNVAAKMSRLQASVRDLYHAHLGGGLKYVLFSSLFVGINIS